MQLHIDPHGTLQCVYGEVIDLASLGPLLIRRASHVRAGRTRSLVGRSFTDGWTAVGFVPVTESSARRRECLVGRTLARPTGHRRPDVTPFSGPVHRFGRAIS